MNTVNTAATDTTAVTEAVEAPVVKRKRGRPVEANSGLQRFRALSAENPTATRGELVALAVSELGLSKATAGSYFHTVRGSAK